jgi:hypothetical protein
MVCITMTEDSPPTTSSTITTAGRIVRAGLIILPFGTILLGFASFGIWSWKKNRVEDRNYRYASAMRQEPTLASWGRYKQVLDEVSRGSAADRLASVASYLESSLGAENMGYTPLRQIVAMDSKAFPVAGILAELTGKKRPREVVLVLIPYGSSEAAQITQENAQLASCLTLAHWLTGEPTIRTVRFAAIPLGNLQAAQQSEALTQLGIEMRKKDERVTHLLVSAEAGQALTSKVEEAFQMAARGTVIVPFELPTTVDESMPSFPGLRDRLLELAEAP